MGWRANGLLLLPLTWLGRSLMHRVILTRPRWMKKHCPVWHKPHQLDLYTCSQTGMAFILWKTRLRPEEYPSPGIQEVNRRNGLPWKRRVRKSGHGNAQDHQVNMQNVES